MHDRYRDAGREVIKIICEFSKCVQRASVDEAYIDLTDAVHQQLQRKVKVTAAQLDNTFVVGYSPEGSNDEGFICSLTTNRVLVNKNGISSNCEQNTPRCDARFISTNINQL